MAAGIDNNFIFSRCNFNS